MRLILFSLFFISMLSSHAQPADLTGKDNIAIAAYYIKYLQDGALLVRLQTKSRKIAILERAGNIAAANKVKSDQMKVNKSIIKAFKDGFTFCPVYFFYSKDSKFVKSYELDSIRFLDKDLKFDQSIIPPKQFLTAEFAIMQEDTAQNYTNIKNNEASGAYSKDSTNDSTNPKKQYSGGTNMSFGALIIKSDQFIQLSRPFPFYTRNLATLPILRRSHFKVVTLLNTKLFDFSNK